MVCMRLNAFFSRCSGNRVLTQCLLFEMHPHALQHVLSRDFLNLKFARFDSV